MKTEHIIINGKTFDVIYVSKKVIYIYIVPIVG